jgi:hypothetical protein
MSATDIIINGAYNTKKIAARASYINGLLIQSRGVACDPVGYFKQGVWPVLTVRQPCTNCAAGKGKFSECRQVKGYWKGYCGSCKYMEKATECSAAE